MRGRVVAAFAVCTFIVGALSACSSVFGPAPTPSPTPTFVTKIVANGHRTLVSNGVNGDQADLGGVLSENASHCLTINTLVIVWPKGTKLLDDGSVVVLGKTLKFGTTVHVGGGFWPPGVPVPAGCHPGRNGYWDAGP